MTRRELTLSTIVRQNKEPVTADVEESVVMMSVEREKYYAIDGVGVRIWQLVASPRRVSELCDILVQEYAIDAEQCRREVIEFLERMASEGLVEVVSEPPDQIQRSAES